MKLILASAVGVIISGCSSVPVQQSAENDSLMACDYPKMQAIDRAAQTQGTAVSVEWLHCPTLKRERN
jgi:uncharacterized protein YceK